MAENSSISRDVMKHALTTAVGVIVTFIVTSMINKQEAKKDDVEKEKQRMESLEKTNTLLNNYISRYDSLHDKYLILAARASNGYAGDGEKGLESGITYTNNTPDRTQASPASITGNWITPDGTVSWSFGAGQLQIGGIGNFAGAIEATGNYTLSGQSVHGNGSTTRLYFNDYTDNFQYNLILSSDGTSLYGSLARGSGVSEVISLRRY